MHQNNAPYETASTLAPWPSPEVGVAEQHAVGPSHSSLPPNLHPVVRPSVSSGRSAPGTGLQACCGLHVCLRQGLGGHVQRACSVGVWTGPQLHWHINCLELLAVHLALNRKWPIRVVLSFLQQGLERRLSPSTLKVYVAAIAANHDPAEGKSVGKHDWVIRFLKGAA